MSKIDMHSPVFLRKFAAYRMIFWGLSAVVVVLAFTFARKEWDKISVLYLVLVSLYANFATDWTNWQAARVEVKQDEQSGEVEVDAHHADVAVKGPKVKVNGVPKTSTKPPKSSTQPKSPPA